MAKKFKKTGTVDFSQNANIHSGLNGNLVIDDPTYERFQIIINKDDSVDLVVEFYETSSDSNLATRIFHFDDPGSWINSAINGAENLIRNMDELTGSTEL